MKYIYCFLCLFALFFTCRLSAQTNRALHWHFGKGLSLSFDQGAPYFTGGSQQFTSEGCASLSDTLGNLLFYTNGGGRDGSPGVIWTRNHGEMYNMSYTEGGGYSSAQSSVAVPVPGSQERYYLFTMEESEFDVGGSVPSQPQGRGLSFFEIDMSLNGGLGGVTDYQEAVYLPTYEGICAVQHANGKDYWIVVNMPSGQGLAVLPVSGNGAGSVEETPTGFLYQTPIKSSPDGKWLAAMGEEGLFLFPFDNASGSIGAPVVLPGATPRLEFSPNSRYLFVAGMEISRYDLSAPEIQLSMTSFGPFPEIPNTFPFVIIGNPQLGPDGRIYFPTIYSSLSTEEMEFLSVIACPNHGGEFLPNELECLLGGNGNLFVSLPNYPAQWLARGETDPMASPADTVVTPGSQVQLFASNGVEYIWSPSALLSCADCPNPLATVEETTLFYLQIEDISGCEAYDTVRIEVAAEPCDFQMPNVFTPDGDQINDLFRPAGVQGPYHLQVWNRWGNLVFDNKGSGDPWNGTQNGFPAASDVYVWTLEIAICGETRSSKGEVALLR